MSQINIQILHQDYVLTCPDGQETQLLEAVERVDQQFQQMRETGKLRSRERIGVLLAVNLAYENLELRQQLQALQQQLAAAQGTTTPVLSDFEAERLQTLETQVQRDQQLAEQLVLRLDEALNQEDATASQQAPQPLATESENAPSLAFDNEEQVELPAQTSESL